MRITLLALTLLAACGAPRDVQMSGLPEMRQFAAAPMGQVRASRGQIARDFIDLSFRLETGDPLPVLTRFEGPITVALRPGAPAATGPALNALLARLRREARIDITRDDRAKAPQIVIEAIPRADIQRATRNAACFVTPNTAGWKDVRRAGGSDTDWRKQTSRQTATIILPADQAPQEIRTCLHEELAQALGPLNDLFGLQNSVFNDDDFHSVLTAKDMLILRIYYSRALANGMSRDAVAARLPGVIAGLHKGGNQATRAPRSVAWDRAIGDVLSADGLARKTLAARRALNIARGNGLRDNRLAFSQYALALFLVTQDPVESFSNFVAARAKYAQSPGNAAPLAHIDTQLAAFALATGDANRAVKLADQVLPVARALQNEVLYARALMIKSEALRFAGRTAQAERILAEALAYGRYGFGSGNMLRTRLAQIKALPPK